MDPFKVIQISDTHLSQKRAYAQHNWEATLCYLNSAKPDLVIHTGDIILDDPDDTDDFEYGYSQLQRIRFPLRILPGGHDVGDSPPEPWMGQYLTKERRDRYLHFYSSDRWSLVIGDWCFIGFNCQLFESSSDIKKEEKAQWKFIEDRLGQAKDRSIALFFHKPPCGNSLSEDGDSVSFIPSPSRKILLDLVKRHHIQLMGTGHRHRYITFQSYGASIVCAPTTGLLSEEDNHPTDDGILRNGIVEYVFNAKSVTHKFVEPPSVKFIKYDKIDTSIPLGSRFLPLFTYKAEQNE